MTATAASVETQLDWCAASQRAARRAHMRREAGMRRAAEHAESAIESWQEKAVEQLRRFIAENRGKTFLIEDFRIWAASSLPEPPDARSFGSLARDAARAGWIVRAGYGSASSSNGSPKNLWRGTDAA